MSAEAWALTVVFIAILVAGAFALGRGGKLTGGHRSNHRQSE
jgi:hypothetical protein